jgi:hypothetical protein
VFCLRINRKTGDYALAGDIGNDPGRGRHKNMIAKLRRKSNLAKIFLRMAKSRKRLHRRHIRSKRKRVNPLGLDGLFDSLVNDSYRPTSRPVLYHYTDWVGAKGILCGHFWETTHDCTNDDAEIKSAHAVIVEVAKSLRTTASGATARVLDFFIETYPRLRLDK